MTKKRIIMSMVLCMVLGTSLCASAEETEEIFAEIDRMNDDDLSITSTRHFLDE